MRYLELGQSAHPIMQADSGEPLVANLYPSLMSATPAMHCFAIERLSVGLLWVNANAQVVYANPAIAQLLGLTPEQLVGRSIVEFDLDLTVDDWSVYCQQARQKSLTLHREYGTPTGHIYLVELQLSYGPIAGSEYYCVNVIDRTAARSIELALQTAELRLDYKIQELAETVKLLQVAQSQLVQGEKMSALGNLVAGVAHEINNPIGFLSGNIDHALSYVGALFKALELYETQYPQQTAMLQPQFEQLDLPFIRSDLPKLIQSMHEGIDRVQSLSDSLRNFSRADREHKAPVYLRDGIATTLLILKHRLKANELRGPIEVICEYADPVEVQCFSGQVNQVFMNILANAIDAIDEAICEGQFNHQNKTPQIVIKIETGKDFESVIVRIQDNGPGMPQEVQNRIFERLFTTKDVGKGTGLGLSIAHEIIVEKHGGTIQVQSELDQGTEFWIKIPVMGTIGDDSS
jgi:PAS domain S-box-containing protein